MLYLTQKNETDLDAFKRFDINDWEDVKKRISYRLINKKTFDARNNEDIIHKDVMDLTMIYTISELSQDRKHVINHDISKEDLERFGKTKEEIMSIAKKNVSEDDSIRIKTLKEEMLVHEAYYPLMQISEDTMIKGSNALIEDSNVNHDNVIIVTNKYNVNGASYMVDFNTLDKVYKRMKDDFYIVPLSTHQLMCINSEYVTKHKKMSEVEDDLLDMLYEINSKNKKVEDILTYRIYKYLKSDGPVLFSIKQNL